HLWPVGDVNGFTEALRTAIDRLDERQSRQIRRFFETHWHFSVLGRNALQVYEAVINDRLGLTPSDGRRPTTDRLL
ncbi:MAG: hypothetical protein KDJ65_39975, partial [Anaerolineae bacterium]|nr:hypothetical protein [Anaerolineae bacterium]